MSTEKPTELRTFLEEYQLAPLSVEEIAAAASGLKDDVVLSKAARDFLKAKAAFEKQLDAIGFEFG